MSYFFYMICLCYYSSSKLVQELFSSANHRPDLFFFRPIIAEVVCLEEALSSQSSSWAGICSRVKGWNIDSWNRLRNKYGIEVPMSHVHVKINFSYGLDSWNRCLIVYKRPQIRALLLNFSPIHCVVHRVHIFTRDETGSVHLPTQLERTLQLYWWW